MRPLLLIARSRGWTLAWAGIAVLGPGAAWTREWLRTNSMFDTAEARVPVVAGIPVLLVVLLVPRLGSPDVALDRATPYAWTRYRTLAPSVWCVLAAAALLLALRLEPSVYGGAAAARNVLGYTGIALLGAVTLGALHAWMPVFAYGCVIYLAAPHPMTRGAAWWAWPMAPGGRDWSWATAVALAVAGVTAYALLGPRESPRGESA